MIKVHIWRPTGDSVGHGSCTLIHDGKTAYISWWPKDGENVVKATGRNIPSLAADSTVLMARNPDATYKFEDLDTAAAMKWWNAAKINLDYRVLSTNCAWAVKMALQAAGSEKKLPSSYKWIKAGQDAMRTSTSVQMVTFGLTTTLLAAVLRRDAASFLADGLVPDLITPSELEDYCKALKGL